MGKAAFNRRWRRVRKEDLVGIAEGPALFVCGFNLRNRQIVAISALEHSRKKMAGLYQPASRSEEELPANCCHQDGASKSDGHRP